MIENTFAQNFSEMLKQKILIIFSFLFLTNILSFAATIKGYVYDKLSGEQLVGAVVSLEGTKYGTVTELDGKFIFTKIPAGTYKLKIVYASYQTLEKEFTVADTETRSFNLQLALSYSTLKEVQITGKYEKGSDEESQNREKNGREIMNVMSAHTISFSPDITVASVLQRVSGVSIENSNAGKQYVNIRGMDKKYNTTLVNGVKIPSPNDRDRYVPMDIFPAELLDRLEVIKSLSPSMEGDATGGVVNMVMKNAPDGLICSGNIAFGYSTIFNNQQFLNFAHNYQDWKSPIEIQGQGTYTTPDHFPLQSLVTYPINNPINTNYGFTIGNRFFNNKLGVIASVSNQNTYKGYSSESYLQSSTIAPAPDKNTAINQPFSDLNYREFSTQSQRLGMMTKLDYQINDNNSISLFATYVSLNEYRVRYTSDSTLGGHPLNGYVFYNEVDTKYETRSTLQDIYNATIQAKHKFTSNFLADITVALSEAKQQLPDDASFTVKQLVNVDSTNKVTIAPPEVGKMSRDWYRNTDKDITTYLNLHYAPGFLRGLSMIDFGGMYRHKTRDDYANRYSLSAVVTDTAHGANNQPYTGSVLNNKYYFANSLDPLGSTNDPGIYTYNEDILAYYGQITYNITSRLNLFGGLRVENTNSGYTCDLPVTVAGKSATYVYTDFLPSAQLKYSINDKSDVRASYFRSIYRPAYGDLVPNTQKTENDDYDFAGNPYLRHTVIDNEDLRYELFLKGSDQLMAGVFNKVIQDPIEYSIDRQSATVDQIQPFNFGTANNYGFELVFRKYFGNFGIAGNYTFTHSQITTPKYKPYIGLDSNNKNTVYVDSPSQTRPLNGQAANIGNISLLYRSPRNKIEAQLAFVYTGEKISLVSPFYNLDLWQKPTLGLDFSIQKQFGKNVTLYLKANNLLNSGYELFIKGDNNHYSGDNKFRFQESSNYVTVEKDFYKASFLFGLKMKL